ncbi:hypothetical protein ACFLZZ_00590 [Nanoarchaeota archaeon]
MTGPKNKEERKRKEIISSFGDDIFKIISEAEAKQGNFSPKIRTRIPDWKSGTRSIIDYYTAIEGDDEGSSGKHRYVPKIISPENAEDLIVELSALEDPTPLKDIFVNLVGHKVKNDYHLMVFEVPRFQTVYGRYDEDVIIPFEDEQIELLRPFKPLNRLKEDSPEVKKIEERLKENSKLYLKGEEPIEKLEKLTTDEYVEKFVRYACPKNASESIKEEVGNSFRYLTEKYLTNPDLMCLIQHDSYPWNHLGRRLVDAGDLKIGSPAIQLGCLYGNPRIYNRLFGLSKPPINANRRENVEYCIGEIAKNYSLELKLDPETIDKAIYVGAIYGNVRLLPAKDFNKQDKRKFRKAALEQVSILKEKDQGARDLESSFLRLGWKI